VNRNAIDRARLEDAVAAIVLQAEEYRGLEEAEVLPTSFHFRRIGSWAEACYSLESAGLRRDAEPSHANLYLTLAQVPRTSAPSDLSSFYLLRNSSQPILRAARCCRGRCSRDDPVRIVTTASQTPARCAHAQRQLHRHFPPSQGQGFV
jgi:hypothetical protein